MSGQTEDVTLNIEDLTLGDLIAIERATGEKVSQEALREPSMALLAGMLWIMERRDNPDLTFAEVCAQPLALAGASVPKVAAGGDAPRAGSRRKPAA